MIITRYKTKPEFIPAHWVKRSKKKGGSYFGLPMYRFNDEGDHWVTYVCDQCGRSVEVSFLVSIALNANFDLDVYDFPKQLGWRLSWETIEKEFEGFMWRRVESTLLCDHCLHSADTTEDKDNNG